MASAILVLAAASSEPRSIPWERNPSSHDGVAGADAPVEAVGVEPVSDGVVVGGGDETDSVTGAGEGVDAGAAGAGVSVTAIFSTGIE